MVVDADGAELVDQHGAVGERRVAQQPVEQARFSRPEKARQHVDRQPAVHQPPPPVSGSSGNPAPTGGRFSPPPAGGRVSPPPTGGRPRPPRSRRSIPAPPRPSPPPHPPPPPRAPGGPPPAPRSRPSPSHTWASDGTSSCLPVAPATRYAQPCQSLICTLRVRAMRLSIRTM